MENTIFVVDNDIPEDIDQYRDSKFLEILRKITVKKMKKENRNKKP